MAKEKFDSVEKERKLLDKKLQANQKSVDRKINKLLKSKKPVNNFNILVGGDALYNLYDKQLFSLIDYPVYGAGELQICWTPIHIKENLRKSNFKGRFVETFIINFCKRYKRTFYWYTPEHPP